MIILKAGNRSITSGSKVSYLSSSHAAGVTTINLVSDVGFSVNDYVLLGEIGSETTEVVQVLTLPVSSESFTCAATQFAHPESTAAYIVKFHEIKFYWTATDTFDTTGPLHAGYLPLQVDDLYTKYTDVTHSTGFGWFIFHNATTGDASTNSNAIPYGDFAENSVKKILDTFFSMLNNKESSLISRADAMSYLNEAYAKATNELNLVDVEWNVKSVVPLAIIGGTQEYLLPDDFSDLISIVDDTGLELENIYLENVLTYGMSQSYRARYYIRGKYIGFAPTPTTGKTFNLYYLAKSTTLSSPYSTLEFPGNNFYFLLDHMVARAGGKIGRSQTDIQMSMANYEKGIALMKMTSIRTSANKDSWSISPEANI